MIGIGKWQGTVNVTLLRFSGDVFITIADNDGAYAVDIQLPEQLQKVKLRFDNTLANAVLDRFGADTMMIPAANSSFTVNVNIIPSAPFYGWICSFGDRAEILAPESVREGFTAHLAQVMGRYDDKHRRKGI